MCRELETCGLETLGPISQMRKLRLTESSSASGGSSFNMTQLPWSSEPTWKSHLCLGSKTSRAFQGKWHVLPLLSQRSGNRGMCSPFRTEETSNRRGPPLTLECPQAGWLPLQGWEVLVSLSYHAEEESFYCFRRERFFYEMDAECYQMPFYHPWFFPFGLLI